LRGNYGVAAYLMFQHEDGVRVMAEASKLPEDLSELVEYMESTPVVMSANGYFPSWMLIDKIMLTK
jgi:hypothetical protein